MNYLYLNVSQYELERRKYAQDLIAFDKEFATLFSGKPRTEQNQDGIAHDDFLKYVQPIRAGIRPRLKKFQSLPNVWRVYKRYWNPL